MRHMRHMRHWRMMRGMPDLLHTLGAALAARADRLAAVVRRLPIVAALLLAAAGAAAQNSTIAVNRCEAGGRVVFQQAPCPPGQVASQVQVGPGNVVATPARPASAPGSAAASAPGPAGSDASTPSPAAPRPPALTQAEACLAYLRPLLRDPASGRILSSERDGRVLRVQLQAADARGRLHTRAAACEFVNGRVDDGWSRIQLERLGWFAPRVRVLGNDREARRAARALEESIEALPRD